MGIDISREALTLLQTRFCGVPMICGDILTMPFKDETFDLIICDLFLHHVVDEGFDKYITEFKRLLRRGGLLLIQEPSILFPLTWVTLLLRRLFYFVTGQEVMGHVHHERPFVPLSLVKTLEQAGFSEINVEASSFVHNRFPLFLGKITALMQKFLFRVPILKYFAWNVIYVGKK